VHEEPLAFFIEESIDNMIAKARRARALLGATALALIAATATAQDSAPPTPSDPRARDAQGASAPASAIPAATPPAGEERDDAADSDAEREGKARGKKGKKNGRNHDAVEPQEDETADELPSGRAVPGDPWGEERGGAVVGPLSFRAMLQARYTATFAKSSTNVRPDYVVRENYLAEQGDGFGLNRFFLRIAGDPSELVGLKAILDFAELADDNAEGTVKQAYATLKPIPKRLKFVAGLFKLPFSTMELDPIAKYELADLGQADALLKDLGFGGRDLGAEAIIAPLPRPDWLHVTVGAFRGHSHDEHDLLFGTVGARLESEPIKGLRLGVDVVDHLKDTMYQRPFDTKKKDVLPTPLDPFYPTAKTWSAGRAWSADISFERYHIAARAEAMIGDRVDADETYGARTFAAAWGLLAYRFRVGPVHLMPAVRAELLDGDREHKIGLRRELSASLNLILSKNARILFDATRTDVEKGSPILDQPKPLMVPPFLELDNTRLVGQLQVEM
jgi:hypothetical protein